MGAKTTSYCYGDSAMTMSYKDEKEFLEKVPERRMSYLRDERNRLLAETDWMGNSDVTMSADWKTYRQALRDITSQTPIDDEMSNITWPKKPE